MGVSSGQGVTILGDQVMLNRVISKTPDVYDLIFSKF